MLCNFVYINLIIFIHILSFVSVRDFFSSKPFYLLSEYLLDLILNIKLKCPPHIMRKGAWQIRS